ncbi:DUF4167 domain-containing protein [Rhizobium paknamense]|uniref:FtsZ-interacting cell division protein ZipA n=1 Tax=Rhizobium paknamense TaxID=1206817 RepID=A0ABU0IJP6_9HYPH|nr:DUF4167 domain-containing protein [Rhizobium paknamense]MDQ0458461.1 FtsZ-interacting cell division protein ZipA [Rhizobium paknamense]
MRPGQQNKRSRGRSNGGNNNNNNFNRKGSNPLTRTYDSSGPDVKIRGTAQHIAEKYMALARDAQSAGDRVMAENYLQHAEHYNRIIAAAQAHLQERVHRDDRSDYNDRDSMDMDGDEMETVSERPQPVQAQPQPQHQPQPQAQPVVQEIAGSGPQPVIEETPVEAEMAAEESAQQAGSKPERAQTRRRSPANRPRRTRRNSGEAAEGGEAPAAEGGEAPALATASE